LGRNKTKQQIMNELKKIPKILEKTTIRTMFLEATDREINEVIEKV